MRITHRLAVLLIAGATTATLTACQGDTAGSPDDGTSATSTSTAPVQDEEAAAAGPGSDTVTADNFVERTSTALSNTATTTFEAEYSGSLAGEGSGVATTFEGRAVYGEVPDAVAIQMTTDLDEDLIKLDDENIWARDQETGGKYLHLTDPDPGYAFRDEQFTDMNVYARTVALDGAVTAVEDRGTEIVGGAETHHYVVTVDLAAADLTALGFDAAAARTGSIDVEYFLDANDLPLRTIIPAPVPGQTLVHTMDIVYDTPPAEIVAPPADQTITAADLDG
ncbi:hypothetical protein [Myceligenerans pegani]|uniref:Lipoprotein n=1 Tax=Myceligenerans pegani TaxID=2776917 RepID=A0ABR9MVI6_9MICO|nr:hypothetical protein [Myceligenerans sp. TRM 65318]MBE1875397.1 hypothetical protein [Myceligenerans sp. TRM 65318]MBE3017668.1 hypothetical protein [Myceligenerans sp. TRM 65318]